MESRKPNFGTPPRKFLPNSLLALLLVFSLLLQFAPALAAHPTDLADEPGVTVETPADKNGQNLPSVDPALPESQPSSGNAGDPTAPNGEVPASEIDATTVSEGTPSPAAALQDPVLEDKNLVLSPQDGSAYPTYADALNGLKDTRDLSVVVRFTPDVPDGRPSYGTIFSVSKSTADKSYFRIYTYTNKLGYKLSDNTGTVLEGDAPVDFDSRTLYTHQFAFVANSTDHTFKFFVNGELAMTTPLTESNYRMLSDLSGLDTVSAGKIVYTGHEEDRGNLLDAPLAGTIHSLSVYNRPLSDDEAIEASTPFDPAAPIVTITEETELPMESGTYPSYPGAVERLAAATDLTVLCKFRADAPNGDPAGNTIFAVSSSSADDACFRLYTLGDKLYYELVNGSTILTDEEGVEINYSSDTAKYNALGFIADSETHAFKLVINGRLAKTVPLDASTYQMLSDLAGLDTVSVGETVYAGQDRFPFTGLIRELSVYDYALGVDEAMSYTRRFDPYAPLVSVDAPVNLPQDGYTEFPDTLSDFSKAKDFTLTAQFMQTGTGDNSLFSVSKSNADAVHFHVYVNGGTLGYQLRGASYQDLSGKAAVLRPNGVNTVAFVANSSNYTFKLYVNGTLAHTQQLNSATYRMLSDLAGADKVTLGMTPRALSANKYPFMGTILELSAYDRALGSQELSEYTAQTPALPTPEVDLSTQPFYSYDSTGSGYFRIPALLTLNNGDVMAAIDARFYGANDSPANLDTAINFKRAGSDTWEDARLVNNFLDHAPVPAYMDSASFIDPQMIQLPDDHKSHPGRILLLVDAYPYSTGINTNSTQHISGMIEVDGEYYLALTSSSNDRNNWASYDHYLKPNPAPSGTGDQYVVYSLADHKPTAYTTNGKFELYLEGIPQTTIQTGGTNRKVPLSIFYKNSPLQLYPTSYLWLIHSDDNGETWSDPQIIGNDQRDERHGNFLGCGPGKGHVVQKGEYAGRVMFSVYDEGLDDNGKATARTERASALYSDDGGDTWTLGERTCLSTTDNHNSYAKSSESQIVELPDGTLRMYARSGGQYIVYTDSSDGGHTWAPLVQDRGLSYNGGASNGVMISVINYSKPINGKPALILSCPIGFNRQDGIIRIGLINEDPSKTDSMERYTVDWNYRYNVNTGRFIYSCLTELPDGRIALLSERDVDSNVPGENPVYTEYTLGELMDDGLLYPAISGSTEPGGEFTVRLPLPAALVESLSDLENCTLTVTYPDSGLPEDTLAYASHTETALIFSGTWPVMDDGSDYTCEISVNTTGFRVVTLDGLLSPSLFAPITGTVSKPVYSGGAAKTFTVTASASEGGRIAPADKRVSPGGQCTFTIMAEDGYTLQTLLLDGSSVEFSPTEGGWTYTLKNVRSGHTLRAVFAPEDSGLPNPSDLQDIAGHWAEDAIKSVVSAGLMNGVGKDRFDPNGTASRAMTAAILYRLAGTPAVTSKAAFSDVVPGSWYADAVAWASGVNVVSGVGADSFAPERSITRQELAALFYRFVLLSDPRAEGSADCLDDFSDSSAIAPWAQDGLRWCVENGIVTGKPGDRLDPAGTATRGELAAMILRLSLIQDA